MVGVGRRNIIDEGGNLRRTDVTQVRGNRNLGLCQRVATAISNMWVTDTDTPSYSYHAPENVEEVDD